MPQLALVATQYEAMMPLCRRPSSLVLIHPDCPEQNRQRKIISHPSRTHVFLPRLAVSFGFTCRGLQGPCKPHSGFNFSVQASGTAASVSSMKTRTTMLAARGGAKECFREASTPNSIRAQPTLRFCCTPQADNDWGQVLHLPTRPPSNAPTDLTGMHR